jgi:hypothetical protein
MKRNLLITLSNKLAAVPHLSKTFNTTPGEHSGPSNSKFIDSPIHFTPVRDSQHQERCLWAFWMNVPKWVSHRRRVQLKINGDAPTVKQTFAPHLPCVRESEGGWREGERKAKRGSGEREVRRWCSCSYNKSEYRQIHLCRCARERAPCLCMRAAAAKRPLLRGPICCQRRCRTRSETNSILCPV